MFSTAKTLSLFLIFGLSLLSGILSVIAVKCLLSRLGVSDKFKRIIGVLNCFSGGVFLGTSILDLLPEARESMEEAKEHYNLDTEYPFTELLVGLGFLLILALEHLSHICCSMTHEYVPPQLKQPQQKDTFSFTNNLRTSLKPDNTQQTHRQAIVVSEDFEDTSYTEDITYQNYGTVDTSFDKTSVKPYAGVLSRDGTPYESAIVFGGSDKIVIKNNPDKIGLLPDQRLQNAFEGADEHDSSLSKLRGLTLMIALSLHMVFDGLALGLLQKESKIWQLFAALALHKVLVFMTIGLQALEILVSIKRSVFVLVVFALVSPCGILIGEGINNTGDEVSRDTASAILQGIATGTFLFVTFFEILLKELGNDHHNITKVIVTVFGFALVAGIRVLEHEEHE